MRLDHIASVIINADHSIMWPAAVLGVANCIADRILFAIPQPTEWQYIGNQIDAALIFRDSGVVQEWGVALALAQASASVSLWALK